MGLSLHNSIAVIQGWMGRKSAFVRTPKKGNVNQTSSLYRLKNYSISMIGEGIMVCYFMMAIGLAFYFNYFGFIVFHSMLLFGYGYIFTSTLKSNFSHAT
jgi:hypothetical protein